MSIHRQVEVACDMCFERFNDPDEANDARTQRACARIVGWVRREVAFPTDTLEDEYHLADLCPECNYRIAKRDAP